jgi:putative nucleotidyltransferase with HDIG domain
MRELKANVKLFLYTQWSLYFIFLILLVLNYGNQVLALSRIPSRIVLYIIMVFATLISDMFSIDYSIDSSNDKAEITVTYALNFAIAFIFTPLEAVLISLLGSIIADIRVKKEWHKVLFNGAKTSFSVGIVSFVFQKFYIKTLPLLSGGNLLTILLNSILYFLIDSSILFTLLSMINKETLPKFWLKNIKKVFPTVISLFLFGVIIIFFFQTEPLMNLFIIPTFVAVYIAMKRDIQIAQETKKTLFALADAVDARIPDTMDHSKRVAILTRDLCNALNVDDERTNIIVMAAKLHDIGKVIIPDAILNKNGKLTEEEYEIIKKHSEEGEKIANKLSLFRKGATFIKFHHERFSGKGYPDGLKGEEIPFGARVINIADSFDAMITPRIYRPHTKSIQEALEEVERCKGTQFDPQIADTFIEMIKSDLERYYELIKLGKVTENN